MAFVSNNPGAREADGFREIGYAMRTRVQSFAGSTTPSIAHRLALAIVWLAMATGGVVFTEPAPSDLIGLGLVVLLPAIGLVAFTPELLLYLAMMFVPVGCAWFGVLFAIDPTKAAIHTAVTLFLLTIASVYVAFVVKSPETHGRVLIRGVAAASVIASLAGMAGYIGLFPGAYDLFTLYGRISGTFKDPNVFGASLAMPSLYFLSILLNGRGATRGLALAGASLLVLCVLLSFSRGAWFVLAVAFGLFSFLSFVTAQTNAMRIRILSFVCGGVLAAGLLLSVALQFDAVSSLISERATLTQSYDEGPEGRFGGQQKAKALILTHPFGIGAQQFDGFYHLEEAHNVYLSVFMNAGWLGGSVFALMIALTVVFGARFALQPSAVQHLFLIVYPAFVGNALEGFIIDLDHWRHFHLLMALCWGLMLGTMHVTRDPRQLRVSRPMVRHIAS